MKRWVNIIVSAIPIVHVVFLMLLCFNVSDFIIDIASYVSGHSILTLIIYVYLYFLSRYKFCSVTKFCVVAMVINHIVYLTGGYVEYETYGDMYTTVFVITALVLGLFTDIRRTKKR